MSSREGVSRVVGGRRGRRKAEKPGEESTWRGEPEGGKLCITIPFYNYTEAIPFYNYTEARSSVQ